MSNSKNLQQTSENQIQTFKKESLSLSLALAIERTNTPLFNIENMVSDILNEFKDVDIEILNTAIKKGSLGSFGQTYRFSTQEVCIWVRKYQESKKVNYNSPIL